MANPRGTLRRRGHGIPRLTLTDRSRRAAVESLRLLGLDLLAELPDRVVFKDCLRDEAARVRDQGGGMALCLIDVDGLREINARVGRQAGDEVLGAIVRCLVSCSDEGVVFRTGGDEFALVLRGASVARMRALMRAVDRSVATEAACLRVSLSWGLAATARTDVATLIRRANAELEAVKRTRRRRPQIAARPGALALRPALAA